MINLKLTSLLVLSFTVFSMIMGSAPLRAANVQPPQQPTNQPAQSDNWMESLKNAKAKMVEYFTSDPSTSTLVQALKIANMDSILTGKQPVTIFAPNNAAFLKLPSDTFKNLLSAEGRDKLVDILKYHVVSSKITPDTLKTMKLKASDGKDLSIVVNGTEITVNGHKIIKSEPIGDNGIVYIIDGVLLP